LFSLLFAVMRGFGMLGPASFRLLVPLGFVLMMALPFIFLTKAGRQQIGLVKSQRARHYVNAILFGIAAPSVCFVAGLLLFNTGPENWFITIRNYYFTQVPSDGVPPAQLFFIVTIPAIIFSPIGEEIFFRGFLQEALTSNFSLKKSMVLESLVFGLVHIFHHGLVRADGQIHFYWSGLLWVMLMFCTAYGFAMLRKNSGSLLPSIVAHAVFNLVMNAYIFSFLATR
jgi:membrane protease YdiL (CAAX protease family)